MRSLPEAFLANRGAPSRTSGRNKKVNSAARFDSLPTPPNSGGGRNGGQNGGRNGRGGQRGMGSCLGDTLLLVRRLEALIAAHPTLATNQDVAAFQPIISELCEHLGVNSG